MRLEARELTSEHVGMSISFGINAGSSITDIGPGYMGNIKIGLFGPQFGHAVTEVKPTVMVTVGVRTP